MRQHKKQKKQRKTRKQSKRRQAGGFAPSVAGGLANALYLAPLAIRAGINLWNRKVTRKRRN